MKTTEINSTKNYTVSKSMAAVFLLWILAVDILFYSETFGLNALVATAISIPIFGWIHPENLRKQKWWIAATIWLFTAIGIFITGSGTAILSFYFAFFYFTAVNSNFKLSIPVGIIQSIAAFAMGIFNYFLAGKTFFTKAEGRKQKGLMNFLMVTIPLLVIIIFLKLYQAADQDFYELTKFINLEFISWGFLFTYLFLSIFLFGFFFFEKGKESDELEDKLQNDIQPTYKDRIQDFFGLKNEVKIGLIILVALNAMLILYNCLDVKFILFDMHDPSSDTTLSEVVHAGIYALIFSIVLVILIVTFILRGQLNFKKNPFLKPMIVFWLIQNLFMIATTSIKNYEYVYYWGLTYKRIGVFVYLFLAVIGLVITLIKVYKKKSFWFLLRSTTLTFAVCLTALLTFNWNRAIAKYNTTFVQEERIDFEYLEDLGTDTYGYILQYQIDHGSVDPWVIQQIKEEIPQTKKRFRNQHYKNTWRSYVWSELKVEQELNKYKFQ